MVSTRQLRDRTRQHLFQTLGHVVHQFLHGKIPIRLSVRAEEFGAGVREKFGAFQIPRLEVMQRGRVLNEPLDKPVGLAVFFVPEIFPHFVRIEKFAGVEMLDAF